MHSVGRGIACTALKAPAPNWNRMPAIMPAQMPRGMRRISQSKPPLRPTSRTSTAAVMYAPTASASGSPGNSVISSAVPGADQAVTTGTFSHQLSTMPDTAAPTEMAHTHDASSSGPAPAARPAWKKISSGPA